MARTDWRLRYLVLRGPMSTAPRVHRWRPGAPYDVTATACGLSYPTAASYTAVMVLDTTVAPTVPRCRRCWP